MKDKWLPFSLAVLGILALSGIFIHALMAPSTRRVPGMDQTTGQPPKKDIGQKTGTLKTFNTPAGRHGGFWPRFRGADHSNVSPDKTALARKWPPEGPRVIWSLDLGEGHSGAAVYQGRVYILDYDRTRQADLFRCQNFDTGKDIWQYSFPVRIKRNHGISRTIPHIDSSYAVAIGPMGNVYCLHPKTGKPYWTLNMVRDHGTEIPQWYNGQCPLVDKGRLILAVGGKDLIIAVNAKTGKIDWRTPNPQKWKITHSSLVPMTYAGHKMYVYCASRGVVGISAKDGRVLWQTEAWKISIANIPTPVILPGGRIFFSGGYNSGAMMARLIKKGNAFSLKTLFRLNASRFSAEQQTPIFIKGFIYGIRQNGEMVCLSAAGKMVWSSGIQYKFGLGPYVAGNGLFYILKDTGQLTLAAVSAKRFTPLSTAKVVPGHDAWAPMALAGGRLLVRDLTKMVCLDVR